MLVSRCHLFLRMLSLTVYFVECLFILDTVFFVLYSEWIFILVFWFMNTSSSYPSLTPRLVLETFYEHKKSCMAHCQFRRFSMWLWCDAVKNFWVGFIFALFDLESPLLCCLVYLFKKQQWNSNLVSKVIHVCDKKSYVGASLQMCFKKRKTEKKCVGNIWSPVADSNTGFIKILQFLSCKMKVLH